MGHGSRSNPFSKSTTVSSLPAVVRDAFNRPLAEGDLCYVNVGRPHPFRVSTITPVMDPKAPANMMEITLTARVRFMAPRDQVNQEFVRILQRSEVESEKPEPSLLVGLPSPEPEAETEPEADSDTQAGNEGNEAS